MSDEFHSEYDHLPAMALARDIMTPEGFEALLDYGAGRQILVNSMRDARQFMHIMSEADAQAFVDAYAGCKIDIPRPKSNKRLLIAILFMQGYSTAEISIALNITQAYVFQSLRLFEKDYPEIKTLPASRKLKRSQVKDKTPGHRRWECAYRNMNYGAFLAELRAHPKIRDSLDDELRRIRGLDDLLPEDPCAEPIFAPWRRDESFPDYTPPDLADD